MPTEKMKFTISWDGPGEPTLVQLVDNSTKIPLDDVETKANSITVNYTIDDFPTHHIEWTFTFIGKALSNLRATVREGDDPKEWPLDNKPSAKNQWNSEGYV